MADDDPGYFSAEEDLDDEEAFWNDLDDEEAFWDSFHLRAWR